MKYVPIDMSNEELEEISGFKIEVDYYRTEEPNLLILKPSEFVYVSKDTLVKHVAKGTPRYITPVSKFYMLKGYAYGELIQKNYWKYGIDKRGNKLNDVMREKYVRLKYITPKENIILLNGKLDILDIKKKELIEIKTSDTKTYALSKLDRAFSQAIIYRDGLAQEYKYDGKGKDKVLFKKYTLKALVYLYNLTDEVAFTYYTMDEATDKKLSAIIYDKLKAIGKLFDEGKINKTVKTLR